MVHQCQQRHHLHGTETNDATRQLQGHVHLHQHQSLENVALPRSSQSLPQYFEAGNNTTTPSPNPPHPPRLGSSAPGDAPSASSIVDLSSSPGPQQIDLALAEHAPQPPPPLHPHPPTAKDELDQPSPRKGCMCGTPLSNGFQPGQHDYVICDPKP